MNNYIRNKLIKLLVTLIFLIVVLCISLKFLYIEDYFNDINKSCRILVSNQLSNILNGHENNNEPYKYTIISLDGKVIKSTENIKEKEISLNSLSFDSWYEIKDSNEIRYSTFLIRDGKIENIVIFTIPKEDILAIRNDINYKLIYTFISFFIFSVIIFIVYKIYSIISKDVLNPIKQMHKSAREILRGNYLEYVNYDYHGEIGEFSHDFEVMRDSLVVAREKEENIKRAEKELLACISHDLKTPIANISGYCEGIIDGVVKEEKDIKRYIGIILKKSRVLNKLLDDILELSKAEINQMTINKKEVYSKEFFEELLEEVSMDVASSGRRFEVNGDIPNLLINLDEEKITQVINNIVSNSIKYTDNDGVISISFSKISDGLEIICRDNGIGIAQDELKLVFSKFYRSEKHRNQNIPGSGLGLSIAKYIVEMHNGNIEIVSGKDKGTTVYVKIRNKPNNVSASGVQLNIGIN